MSGRHLLSVPTEEVHHGGDGSIREKFYCVKNRAEQPAFRTNMGDVKWSIIVFCDTTVASLNYVVKNWLPLSVFHVVHYAPSGSTIRKKQEIHDESRSRSW